MSKALKEQLYSTGLIERIDLESVVQKEGKIDKDKFSAWLESVIAEGWDISKIANYLGVKENEVSTIVAKYINKERLKKLFLIQKTLLRASVLAKAEETVKVLQNIIESGESSNSEKIKAAEVLTKMADLKEIEIDGEFVNEDAEQSEQILERFEVLQTLIGEKARSGSTEGKNSSKLEGEQKITARS